jgi:hypothetical protein
LFPPLGSLVPKQELARSRVADRAAQKWHGKTASRVASSPTVKTLAAVLILSVAGFAQQHDAAPAHPLVFIDGNGSEPDAARNTPHVKRDDQTMELARNLLKFCPEVSITRDESAEGLDYLLLLNRGDEYGMFRNAVTQVMLLDAKKNVVYSSKQGTAARAAKDGCKAILADWQKRRNATKSPSPWNTSH